MKPSLPDNIYSILLNSLKDAFVFVDTDHIIQYMNSAAILKYKDGESLQGKSIFSCHNSASKDMIIEIFGKMKSGLVEEIITDNERHRIYMRAVRDGKGNLLGYYERFEPPVKR
jgi:DUF438 domain-containing protein